MVDWQAFHDGVATLLAEMQRIKSEGDYDAAKTLFETHGIYFDPALRDEVVARVESVGLPSYSGFMGLIRFRGRSLKGDYDVHDGDSNEWPATTPAV